MPYYATGLLCCCIGEAVGRSPCAPHVALVVIGQVLHDLRRHVVRCADQRAGHACAAAQAPAARRQGSSRHTSPC